jgi:hypothetical protein
MSLFRPIITSINNLNTISFKATYTSPNIVIENEDRYHDSVTFITVSTVDSTIVCDFTNYIEGDVVVDYNCSIPANIYLNSNGSLTLYATLGISNFTLFMTVYGNGKRAPQPLIYEKGWDSNFNHKNPYVYISNNISFSDDVLTKGIQTVTLNKKSYNHTHVTLNSDSVLLNTELSSNSYYYVDSSVTSITLVTTKETTSQETRTYEKYDNPAEGMICNFDLIQNRTRDLEIKQKRDVNDVISVSTVKKFDKTLCKEAKRIKLYLYENNWIALN